MRVLACIFFNSSIVLYYKMPNTEFWWAFDLICRLITILLFCYICLYPQPKPNAIEKLLLRYTIGSTFALSLYTFMCVYMKDEWVTSRTDLFTFIYTIAFAMVLLVSGIIYIFKKYDTGSIFR